MPRPKQYDDALAGRLIEAAMVALASGGLDALSLRAVTAAAGTSTNAVYAIFGGKTELVAATVRRAEDSFTAAQRAALTPGPATKADLRRLGHAYRAWALSEPAMYAVMFGPVLADDACPQPVHSAPAAGAGSGAAEVAGPPAESIGPLVSTIESLITQGVLAGEPTRVSLSVWAATHGAVSLELARWPGASWAEALFDAHLDAIERGWRA